METLADLVPDTNSHKPTRWRLIVLSVVMAALVLIARFIVIVLALRSDWYVAFIGDNKIFNYTLDILNLLIYALLGTATYIAYIKAKTRQERDLIFNLFLIQLGLSVLWAFVLFGFDNVQLAFVLILLMTLDALWLVLLCFRNSQLAGWLFIYFFILLIYAYWVTYQGFLFISGRRVKGT